MTQPSTRERPLGITILAILAAIAGVIGLITYLPAIGLGALAIIGLVLAIVYLAFAYGAWTLQAWGWTLGVALAAVGILFALFWLTQGADVVTTLVNIVIPAVILYYLFQPDVKAAFGRT